jgi:hypothetical protein
MKTTITIFPSDEQQSIFQHWQNNTRWVWNECVGRMNDQYDLNKTIIRKAEFKVLLDGFITNIPWLSDTPYTILEFTINELDADIQRSITNNVDLPTFKRKKKERNSVNIQLYDTITVTNEVMNIGSIFPIKCVKSKFIKKQDQIKISGVNGEWIVEVGNSHP